jgi:hypothetical protein
VPRKLGKLPAATLKLVRVKPLVEGVVATVYVYGWPKIKLPSLKTVRVRVPPVTSRAPVMASVLAVVLPVTTLKALLGWSVSEPCKVSGPGVVPLPGVIAPPACTVTAPATLPVPPRVPLLATVSGPGPVAEP